VSCCSSMGIVSWRASCGKDLWGVNGIECLGHNNHYTVTMPKPDDKLSGSLCRSLGKATLISSPSRPPLSLVNFPLQSNAKGGSHHQESALSRTLEVLSLRHIIPRQKAFCISLLQYLQLQMHRGAETKMLYRMCPLKLQRG